MAPFGVWRFGEGVGVESTRRCACGQARRLDSLLRRLRNGLGRVLFGAWVGWAHGGVALLRELWVFGATARFAWVG